MEELRRTKIVCTIGPASDDVPILRRMIAAGMDAARLNFSHGSHAEHAKLLQAIRTASSRAGRPVTILQDLQGPKMRLGALPKNGLAVRRGEHISLIHGKAKAGSIAVNAPTLSNDVRKGHRIFFCDGNVEGEVIANNPAGVEVRVMVGGVLRSHGGINVPDSLLSAPSFTAKDRKDLLFGIEQEVDWVLLSFVDGADDISLLRTAARAAARAHEVTTPRIMAKIELKQALANFDDILEAADGILLGRGDLGVEIPPEEVPVVQKDVIEACRLAGKPVIIATHMLDSMTTQARATRAETNDVATAVFDHADAVMLSAESATGRYPVVTVQAMAAVIAEAERSRFAAQHPIEHDPEVETDYGQAIARLLHSLAVTDRLDAIALSALRPEVVGHIRSLHSPVPIFVVVADKAQARQMHVFAGVVPIVMPSEAASLPARLRAHLVHQRLVSARARLAIVIEKPHEVTLTLPR